MKLIVAVDESWGIGCNNKLLFSIPEDMSFFKQSTQGKIVVMGHSTFKSLPNEAPLKNRINVILTKNEGLKIRGAITCHSIGQLRTLLSMCYSEDVYVIGGHSIYKQLIEYCDEAYVTKVYVRKNADTYFPDIDHDENWTLKEQSELKNYNGINYRFCVYVNTFAAELP